IFDQLGGTNSVGTTITNQSMYLAVNAGSSGFYNLSGTGALTVNGQEYIGNSGFGSFNQTGGTHTVTTFLYLGYNSGSSGFYSLSGSGILAVNSDEKIGVTGFGSFTQSAGTHSVTGTLYVAWNNGGAYSLSGGALAVQGAEQIGAASNSSGTFNQ